MKGAGERRDVIAGAIPFRLAVVSVGLLTAAAAAGGAGENRPATHPSSAQPSAVVRWNETTLEAIRRSSLGPPATARALAIVSTCVYDAWAAYHPRALGTELGAALRQPPRLRTGSGKRAAVSFAAYRALVDLFPAERPLFDAQMARLGLEPDLAAADSSTPAGVANLACGAVLARRHGDGANQLGDQNGGPPYSDYTGYAPVNTQDAIADPNRWQPITFSTGVTPGFLAPHWGLVTPFAIDVQAWRPPPPALHPDPRYREQAAQVLGLSAELTDREKVIAEYWADGPRSELPPGHWNLFAQVVSRRDRQTLDEDVVLLFALNNALMDAGIAAWDCKRHYDYVRPITAIRFLFAGQAVEAWGGPGLGTRVIDGGDWLPYQPGRFITPPFAEYVSGHSTFSAAAAEILKRFTGSDWFGYGVVIPPGWSQVEPGITPARPVRLYWRTFSAAADEAGWSRLLGGIHFADGNDAGRALGRRVGAAVWRRVEMLVRSPVRP